MSDKRQLKSDKTLCRVADEPVVVLKFPPVKPGNGVEDKTEMTCNLSLQGLPESQKHWQLRRGEVYLKVLKHIEMENWRTSHLTRWASINESPWEQGS